MNKFLENATLIFEGNNSIVYKTQANGQDPMVLKVMKQLHVAPEQLALFNNEYDIIENLDIKGIRKAYQKTEIDGKAALLLEYIEGKTLKNLLDEKKVNLGEFLEFAIQTCDALGDIHQYNIIHKDINSNNILVTNDNKVKIIDFGISSKITLKTQNLGNPEKLQGTLSYISPEQTGRMNRIVDYRTDLYSLGVVFYEMLTGKLPFQSDDALELVHSHLAKPPESPHKVKDTIPEVISNIILKLLSKNAEDRYQSAFGIKADFAKVREQFKKGGVSKIALFTLATEDYSGRFQIPQKLYGRAEQIRKILSAYEKACWGSKELMLISGYSGVGKSALVHEIHKPVTQQRGYFIEGKFDQLQRSQPYFAWVQAFEDFIQQILTQSQNDLEEWRKRIMQALGNNGKVLTSIIPDLEFIIGEQPEVETLGATEEQNRFNYVLQNFVNAISKKDHPLVIFIDDWQWADSASLNLLKTLLTNQSEDYLMIICAYRDNEITEAHPFMAMVDDMGKEGISIDEIHLDNLNEENLEQIIADTLRTKIEKIKDFSVLIYSKTRGNAFFVNQMLKSLYEEELLWFDYREKEWKWDFEKIKAQNITENVVELMAAKIQKLPQKTQDTLKLAACIGGSFELPILAIIDEDTSNEDTEETRLRLEEALIEGMIVPKDNMYRFSHDRVQQAVYSLIPEEKRKEIHLKIGKLLQKNIPKEEQAEHIFDITNQLNYGLELIDNEEDKVNLATLNLAAGRKAQASAAYKPSIDYLNTAISLISDTSWDNYYELHLKLYTQYMQTCFLKKDFEEMMAAFQKVIENAKEIRDTVRVYEIKMQYLIGQGNQQEALNTGLEIIEKLNVKLVEETPTLEDIDSLKELKDMQNLDISAAMRILDSIITPAWAIRPDLFVRICYTMIDLSMSYGNSASSAVAYAFYGGWLCGTAGEIEKGYKFGKIAMFVLAKFKTKYLRSKIENLYVSTVMHWKEQARSTIQPHYEAIQIGLETGDIEFACYNIVESMHYHFLMGIDLPSLLRKYEKNHDLIYQLKQEFHLFYLIPWEQMILNLLGTNEQNSLMLKGEIFDEEEQLPNFIEENQLTLAFVTFQAKTFLAYYFGEYEKAREYSLKTDEYKGGVGGMLFLPVHNFFSSLILLECIKQATETEKAHYFERILQNQAELKPWAEASPENHEHRYLIIEALLSQWSNEPLETMRLYDEAIEKATENKFIQDEALANELAARFFLNRGQTKIAKAYLSEAHMLYNAWGAKAKSAQLEQQYLNILVSNNNTGTTTTQISTVSTSIASPNLDLRTIIKASQTLSGEVIFNQLLKKMMQIVIENAGAETGLLMDRKGNKLFVKAKGRVGEEIEILENEIADEPTKYPLSITNYVGRTQEFLVLFHATEDKNYQSNAYVQQHKPKSVLCFPVVKKGELWGIIYLENNLIAGAFTPERLEVLKILSTQIVISMENSSLYENLEEKVRERTAEVRRAKEIIEKKNHDITSSINYAKRIQTAMLPRNENIENHLGEHFILFKPRDIVSGDFYFFSAQNENKIVITAADCTGHGVPGAFMSLIGHELLNKIVNLRGIIEPDKVLEQLHLGVNRALRQESGENKDGMDMSLCVIDKSQKTLDFAGAKNPLVYIQGGALYEIKGDKMPIGGMWKNEKHRTFEKHSLNYTEETYFYIFSDGLQDQFGGPEGRKFMKKKLKKLLFENHQKPMQEQRNILRKALDDWMINSKQLDDILLIGFRLD